MDKQAILKNSEVKINFLEEPTPVRGNVSAISPEEDRKVENQILSELEFNPLAWCMVQVQLFYTDSEGNEFEGSDVLGGVSIFESDDKFSNEIFEEVKEQALEDLIQNMKTFYAINEA